MKRLILLTLIFMSSITAIDAQEINSYDNLQINTQVSSSLILERQNVNSKIENVYANLTFFPQENEFQDVSYYIESNPTAEQETGDHYAYFRWDKPNVNELSFNINAQENTKTNFNHIKTKIKFPLTYNNADFKEYLEDTEIVTSKDPKIIAKANELAQGEDDLFILVHKIGAWTKENIEYSLETLTADVSQDASWVLENKRGVCDELTSLFIAMLRSLNIPARFVTGQSYTNILNDFGNHAWAEVYFPGYGWVAFDPTYGQLGYVDASHIKMKTSNDIQNGDINYGWVSSNVNVESSGLNVKSNVISLGNLYKENIELKLTLLKNDVGPSSYVPVKVDVKNLNDYYLPVSIYVNKAPLKIEDFTRELILKPNEEESAFFILKIPRDVEEGYVYTSDVLIKDNFENSVTGILHFTSDGEVYNLDEAENIVDQFKEEEQKIYSKNVELTCGLDKDYYYEDESGRVICNIINKGNTNLQNLNICYNNDCKIINLNIVESEDLEFKFTSQDEEFLVTADNNDINKFFIINPKILKLPDLKINLIGYPTESDYFSKVVLRMNLDVNSEVKNVKINLNNKNIYELESFNNNEDFEVILNGYDLKEYNIIEVFYDDKNNNLYNSKKEFIIKVNKPFYIKYFWIILIVIILILISMILRRKQQKTQFYRS